ncbi:hypothetical protein LV564_04315 [Komagataeibacter nataicola]|uniref:hypothetical protein n=1 Tax=Komagataeibacter nataicola TaxID=265960 RepID=UPI0011B7F18E|nr:hypothetical protein [Komagataeibacter nataicola]WEQ56326.1 hypothetical protein LV564_04315 [Komagataeibacter nataicola]WNM07897.1 hypothetical protein RI056_12915 [Komagataeibacter nataicola]
MIRIKQYWLHLNIKYKNIGFFYLLYFKNNLFLTKLDHIEIMNMMEFHTNTEQYSEVILIHAFHNTPELIFHSMNGNAASKRGPDPLFGQPHRGAFWIREPIIKCFGQDDFQFPDDFIAPSNMSARLRTTAFAPRFMPIPEFYAASRA